MTVFLDCEIADEEGSAENHEKKQESFSNCQLEGPTFDFRWPSTSHMIRNYSVDSIVI